MSEKNFRNDFAVFRNTDYVYLDTAATAQRPDAVINAGKRFYEEMNANPLRGLYELSMAATDAYENARAAVKEFIGADSEKEIMFTRNTSESLNLVAYSYGLSNLKPGDEIVSTIMEHHSNMLPWQMVAEKTGARLVYLVPDKEGIFSKEEIETKINERTKLVCIAHVSNVLGCVNPVKEIADRAHGFGAKVVVDGAQSTPHMKVDVKELGADFFAFSGHKLMGPFGIGVLYGKKELLEAMPPFMRGGEMIESVSLDGAKWAELPHKFEAGTVNAAGAYELAEAIKYLQNVGFDHVREVEDRLTKIIFEEAENYPYMHIFGSEDPLKHNGIVTFTIDDVHPHDISSILDESHICIRAGHHCAEPLMKHIGASSTARASLYFYNNEEDVRFFMKKIKEVRRYMGFAE